ncbi:MAG TPA: transposase [Candidatus Limnocylindria bacterium]|nr:transposase [Candidatus Limnocylindria bacterium]
MPQSRRPKRSFSAQAKLEIVLAGMRADRSVREVCREHDIAETVYYRWRDQLLEAARAGLGDHAERSESAALRKRIAELERALGKKTLEAQILGEALRGWE